MTQEELAERSELAWDTVRRLEKGSFSPSLETLRKVCVGLGISISTLFSGLELPNSNPALADLLALLGAAHERSDR